MSGAPFFCVRRRGGRRGKPVIPTNVGTHGHADDTDRPRHPSHRTHLPAFAGFNGRQTQSGRTRYFAATRRAVSTLTVVTGTSPLNDPRTVAVGDTGASRIVTMVSIPSTTRPNAA